ncbi:MAG TPA: hypothetical protein VEC99_17860, partial [Clostridia bacterium]|nr:hypothetical protein [Clostridia bacterium]
MKVRCSCGAKYEFDVTPEMATNPVRFICPACGFNASEFVDGLIRQELGQTSSPTGVPIPITPPAGPTPSVATPPSPAPQTPKPQTTPVAVRIHKPQAAQPEPEPTQAPQAILCLKHPGEVVSEKCRVCSKPICPKCMELFGYVCSPLCKARAESHGIDVPVYEGQKSVVEARQWRKVVFVGTTASAILFVLAGVWFWYAWFGSTPKTFFSVRFPEPSYSGQSAICGQQGDQIVFLHGGTLARHDMKLKKAIWSRELVDRAAIRAEAEKELKEAQERKEKGKQSIADVLFKPPSLEKLTKSMERSAAAVLSLHVRGQNVWVGSPGKLTRYDWDTGKPVKELAIQESFGGMISRGDELLLMATDSGNPVVTHISLLTGECREEGLPKPEAKELAASKPSGPAAGKAGAAGTAKATRPQALAG